MERHDHVSEALQAIDAELARPPITIEESLAEAVLKGRMSAEEATECLDAYIRCLNKGHEQFSIDVDEV